jgi:hypothetical protein
LETKVAIALGLPATHAGAWQLVQYDSAVDGFAAHTDCPSSVGLASGDPYKGGKGDGVKLDRLVTVLIYLNSLADNQGGHTTFPTKNTSFAPIAGRAVLFLNMQDNDVCDSKMLHFGGKVEQGESDGHVSKLLLAKWWHVNATHFNNLPWKTSRSASKDVGTKHGLNKYYDPEAYRVRCHEPNACRMSNL